MRTQFRSICLSALVILTGMAPALSAAAPTPSTKSKPAFGTQAIQAIQGAAFFSSFLAQEGARTLFAPYAKQTAFEWPEYVPAGEQLAYDFFTALMTRHKAHIPFLFGASTSEHQNSKQCTPGICSWSRWAQDNNLIQPTHNLYSIDLWTHYRAYIDHARDELHLNSLRFSIEWALVEPKEGVFDQQALDHYADLFVYAIQKGITPIVCFHHYTDPCWFIDQGGFERKKNIPYFVRFCNTVYAHLARALHQKCGSHARTITHYWATYNSPEGYAFKGYYLKQGPPSTPNKNSLSYFAQVLMHMMEAHVAVYSAMKITHQQLLQEHITTAEPQIGFLKNILQLDPALKTLGHYLALPATWACNSIGNMLQSECIYQFFETGTFKAYVPGLVNVRSAYNPHAKTALDFIGLNYYSNRYQHVAKSLPEIDANQATDNDNYRIYPQGLYRAIGEIYARMSRPVGKAKLLGHIPIIVTENGVATDSDAKRAAFYRDYMYSLFKAVEQGYPVIGYLTWTLADNYEWPSKGKKRRLYGLCSVDPHDPAKLTAKPGALIYLELVRKMDELQQLLATRGFAQKSAS